MKKFISTLFVTALLLTSTTTVKSREVRHRRVKSNKSDKISSNIVSEDTLPRVNHLHSTTVVIDFHLSSKSNKTWKSKKNKMSKVSKAKGSKSVAFDTSTGSPSTSPTELVTVISMSMLPNEEFIMSNLMRTKQGKIGKMFKSKSIKAPKAAKSILNSSKTSKSKPIDLSSFQFPMALLDDTDD
mmetsp:Transcript_23763/g.49723  ORF Transcript_23763/g.49723 Transcript_23763/m.49723 type:complete len:184 (-) Transcript_23763:176-727(-)